MGWGGVGWRRGIRAVEAGRPARKPGPQRRAQVSRPRCPVNPGVPTRLQHPATWRPDSPAGSEVPQRCPRRRRSLAAAAGAASPAEGAGGPALGLRAVLPPTHNGQPTTRVVVSRVPARPPRRPSGAAVVGGLAGGAALWRAGPGLTWAAACPLLPDPQPPGQVFLRPRAPPFPHPTAPPPSPPAPAR